MGIDITGRDSKFFMTGLMALGDPLIGLGRSYKSGLDDKGRWAWCYRTETEWQASHCDPIRHMP
jgi:hypothetical protein